MKTKVTRTGHHDDQSKDIAEQLIGARDKKIKTLRNVINGSFFVLLLLMGIIVLQAVRYDEIKAKYDDFCSMVEKDAAEVPMEYLIGYTLLHPSDTITEDKIYTIAAMCGAYYPEVVVQQAILESGNPVNGKRFSSNIANNAHNLMGMRKVTKRKTLQSGEYNGYGSYLCWEHSIIDRVLWEQQTFNDTIPTKEQYMEKIKNIYAEDSLYIHKLNKLAAIAK